MRRYQAIINDARTTCIGRVTIGDGNAVNALHLNLNLTTLIQQAELHIALRLRPLITTNPAACSTALVGDRDGENR